MRVSSLLLQSVLVAGAVAAAAEDPSGAYVADGIWYRGYRETVSCGGPLEGLTTCIGQGVVVLELSVHGEEVTGTATSGLGQGSAAAKRRLFEGTPESAELRGTVDGDRLSLTTVGGMALAIEATVSGDTMEVTVGPTNDADAPSLLRFERCVPKRARRAQEECSVEALTRKLATEWSPYASGYLEPPPASFDRSWDAALGGASDAGLQITSADRASGRITGLAAATIEAAVTIELRPQTDGSLEVAFHAPNAIERFTTLKDRWLSAYHRRMGR